MYCAGGVHTLRGRFCSVNLAVKIGQRQLEHLAQPWIVSVLDLMQDALAGQLKSLYFADAVGLLGSKLCFPRRSSGCRFCLLFFNGLTFPPASHENDYRSAVVNPERLHEFSDNQSILRSVIASTVKK